MAALIEDYSACRDCGKSFEEAMGHAMDTVPKDQRLDNRNYILVFVDFGLTVRLRYPFPCFLLKA
jgi:hypothetical protein